MTIPNERKNDISKLAQQPEIVYDVLASPIEERARQIMATSRALLGLEGTAQICELAPDTQEELLFAMRTLRDAVNPHEPSLWQER